MPTHIWLSLPFRKTGGWYFSTSYLLVWWWWQWAFQVAQWVKNPSAMKEIQETRVWFLGWEDPLEESMAVFLPGESHGQRSLEGCSPWGHKRVRLDWNDWACPDELSKIPWRCQFPFPHLCSSTMLEWSSLAQPWTIAWVQKSDPQAFLGIFRYMIVRATH